MCAAYVAVMFLLNGYVNTNAMMAPKAMPPHLKATAAGILAVTYQVTTACDIWLIYVECGSASNFATLAAACTHVSCFWLPGGALHGSDPGHRHHPGFPWRLLSSHAVSVLRLEVRVKNTSTCSGRTD